jgi:hypothetical protein
MNTRPLSIAHLVFGLIFLGTVVLWAVGAATDADAPDIAQLAPAVLIGAGLVGLVGIVINARRRDAVPTEPLEPGTAAPDHAGSGVVHEEEHR